jgi:stage II sporulation protein D
MKKRIIILVVTLLLVSSFQLQKSDVAEAASPEVSIFLKEDVKNLSTLTFSLKGSFKEAFSGKSLIAGKTYTVKVENDLLGLYDGSQLITKRSDLSLKPAGVSTNHLTTLNGKVKRSYLGTMNFKVEDTFIRPVNVLPLEEYIQGVLPGEIYGSYHIHAMKAQAIAARTYATYWLDRKPFDDTIAFHRYVGYSPQYHDFIKATYETKGKVLKYNGKTIDAVYSASNGGYSETNTGAWPREDAINLSYFPAKADPYDAKMAHSRSVSKTQVSLTGLDVNNPDAWWNGDNGKEKNPAFASQVKKMAIPNEVAKVVDITGFTIASERTEGKRVKSADVSFTYIKKDSTGKVVTDEKGAAKKFETDVTLSGSQFRYAAQLNSTYVTSFTPTTSEYKVSALGNGHGVGMSQTGADVMGKKGKGFREILAFYYPGTIISHDKTSNIPTTAMQVKGTINYQGTNIRKTPTGSVITTGKLGQSVIVIGKSGAFFKVKTGTITGYINEHYVDIHQTISYKNGITPITSGQILYLGSPIVSKNNTLYVPMPGLASRYKMKLSSTSTNFTVVDGSRKIVASHLSKYATINGKKILLTAKPEKYYNKIYVPLAFLKQTGLSPSYYDEKAEQVLWINR